MVRRTVLPSRTAVATFEVLLAALEFGVELVTVAQLVAVPFSTPWTVIVPLKEFLPALPLKVGMVKVRTLPDCTPVMV